MKNYSLFIVFVFIVSMFSGFSTVCAAEKLNGTININTADLAHIVLLPGIGKAKAKAIIDARTLKVFNSVNDLMKVKGIGKKLIKKIRPYAVVNGKTTMVIKKTKRSKKHSKK